MIIHDRRIQGIRDNYNLIIDDEKLNYVKESKYLGVIVDNNLTFNSNAAHTSRKIASKVNLLCRLRFTVSNYIESLIYKTIVLPHINYCNTLMLNYTDKKLCTLQKIQNKAMRAILGKSKFVKNCAY
ncbi:Protein of unknown function [Cotesia congregata]|uniref:Uncharacterized protein n=1 Tax=Cotesia congregata TaxID=51543 RepID=A0A8J2EHA0_COTCN|nr:Protein of unknown function [Cotesia congregata]